MPTNYQFAVQYLALIKRFDIHRLRLVKELQINFVRFFLVPFELITEMANGLRI